MAYLTNHRYRPPVEEIELGLGNCGIQLLTSHTTMANKQY